MAKKGVRYFVTADWDEGTSTYTNGVNVSPVATVNVTVNKSSGKDYGDDKVVDSDDDVTGFTMSVEFNHDEDALYTGLLGHKEATASHEISFSTEDEAPKKGCGFVNKTRISTGNKWLATWYNQVRFSEPNDENQTKGESTTFQHVTFDGTGYVPDDGIWKRRKTFDTAAAAIAWINAIAGISA